MTTQGEAVLTLRITGTRPLMMHNGRMANPIDPWTRKLKELTNKRKKTDLDLADIARIEARGACWETEDGLLGIPAAAVWRTIFDAAKAYKRGEDIKRALSFEDVTRPVYIGERTVSCDEFTADPGNIDYRPVKLMGRKTMRARPILRQWATVQELTLLTDVVDPRDLGPILERAGRLVGLGDWRPIYGTFTAEVN